MNERIVKRCGSCEEDFAGKYRFCPNCGAKSTEISVSPVAVETVEAPASSREISGARKPDAFPPTRAKRAAADYRPTIIREKNVKQRYALLGGAMIFLTICACGAFVFSIFNKNYDLAAIDEENVFSFINDIDPTALDPSEDLKKADKTDGGGGGGDQDQKPAQKGRLATQTDNPLFAPSKDYVRLTDPAIKIRASTLGTKQAPQTDEPYGLQTGGLDLSDGQGCCGGQGGGTGKGQGNDQGGGAGPGKNGGLGLGGDRPTGGIPDEKTDRPPEVVRGVTEPLKIISKPRANYTDTARLNMVQGKVVLKVTFLASGEVGAVIPVRGLPDGLTERAIAAARAIKFEPAKINGKAVSVSKTIEYNFAIF